MSDITPSLQAQVVARAGNRCEYCQLSQIGQEATFHVDHVVPRSADGPTTLDNLALAGGGIRGGQVIGRTDRDAAEVVDRPISVTDFLATVCTIMGIDFTRQNRAPGVERPIPIVDTSKQISAITELL